MDVSTTGNDDQDTLPPVANATHSIFPNKKSDASYFYLCSCTFYHHKISNHLTITGCLCNRETVANTTQGHDAKDGLPTTKNILASAFSMHQSEVS